MSDVNMCVLISIGAVVLYMVLQPSAQPRAMTHTFSQASGMISSVVNNVSARLSPTVPSTVSASAVSDSISVNAQIYIAPHGATKGDEYKSVTVEQKDENANIAQKWIKEHDKALIMIFAPWCSHCHNAMGPFSQVVEESKIPSLMINAETVPRHTLTGPKALYQVEYFPLFLKKNGTSITSISDPATGAAELQTAPSTAAGVVASVTEESPFADLF